MDLIAGRYLPQRMLGRGGAKEVWLAHDLTLDRPVAIARARSGSAGAEARARMRREARLMARLGDHPNIVTVYDAVEDGDVLHIVARYMAGGSLAERLAAAPGGRLPVDEVLRTGRSLADALAHAHEHGVVHRDVKPDNVWLAGDGSAGLGDFGIAMASDDPVSSAASATGRRTTRRPSRARARRRCRSPTSTRSGRRYGSCCAAVLRSPARMRSRCSRSTATPSRSRRRATPATSRRGSTRWSSPCSPSGPPTGPSRRRRCATRSTGWAGRRGSPSSSSRRTASR